MVRRYKKTSTVQRNKAYLHLAMEMHHDTYKLVQENKHKIKQQMRKLFDRRYRKFFLQNYKQDDGTTTFERAWRGRHIFLTNRESKRPTRGAEYLFDYLGWQFYPFQVALAYRPVIHDDFGSITDDVARFIKLSREITTKNSEA